MLLLDCVIYIFGVGNFGKYVVYVLVIYYLRFFVILIFCKKDFYDKFVDGGRKIIKWIDEYI